MNLVDGHDAETVVASDGASHGAIDTCPACYGGPLHIFHHQAGVPANSCILFKTEREATSCLTSEIRLGLCPDCGFIINTAFDQARTEYSGRYEETQAFSGTFNKFHAAIAQRLIDRHGLHQKDVLEIGCGKGEFLMLLAELGDNRCVGIDPGVHIERIKELKRGSVECIADFYSEKYSSHNVDFLVCKMTLEHISDPERFVSTISRGLRGQKDAVVFFQIPESLRILRECAFEDIYHEHCAYFTPGSLARLFRRCGFDVLRLDVEYADQYLTIEARLKRPDGRSEPASEAENDLAEIVDLVSSFPERLARKQAHWRGVLQDAAERGAKVALWGSGSKAVSFLHAIDVAKAVRYVTDVNPYRHNHYMPLSGQRIVAPAELADIKPDLVIAMNAIYEKEIRSALDGLGLAPELRCL